MNLIENEEENKRRKNTKTIMIIIVALIVFLLIVCMVLLFLIDDIERNTLKLNIDNKSTQFSDNLFVFEGDKCMSQ